MVIESQLTSKQLKQYRHWKQDVRISLGHISLIARLIKRDKSLRRLFDSNFFPLFIGGVAGSGTTLIGALLNQNFESRLNFIGSEKMKESSRLLWREKGSSYDSFEDYVAELYEPTRHSVRRIRAAILGLYRRSASYPYSSAIVFDKNANSRLIRAGILRKAFPKSGLLLIYRNPVEVIDGLLRKWPKLYGDLNIEEMCDFWNLLHYEFLKDCEYDNELVVISYNDLVEQNQEILEALAQRYALVKRGRNKDYESHENHPGKGLRNVKGGKI
jgi:hypothetical protein